MTDLHHELDRVSSSVYNCRKCGMCGNKMSQTVTYVCPVKEHTEGFEPFYARGKLIIAQGLLEDKIKHTPELVTIMYSCSLCGNCVQQCAMINPKTGLPLVDTIQVVEATRTDLLREHPEYVPPEYRRALAATRSYDNPWGVGRKYKNKWAYGLSLKNALKDKSDVLFFIGCTIAASPLLIQRARKAVLILQQAGIDMAILGGDEPCCGSVQRRIGDSALFEDMQRRNIELINSLNVKEIITMCAGCYHTLKKEYSQSGTFLKSQVFHIVEYLSSIIQRGGLSFEKPQNIKVSYHDPCHLGRQMKIFEPPRQIIASLPGIELVERRATKENTVCCGAGGGMRMLDGGDLAVRIGKDALLSAVEAGAEAIVTACPFCEMNLDTASQTLDSALPVYDIVDMVYDAIDFPEDHIKSL